MIHRSRLPVILVLSLAIGALSACGSDKKKDTLGGNIGPGSGGPTPVPLTGTPTPENITRPDGTVIGQFTYDNVFFVFTADPAQIGLLTAAPTGAPNLTIYISHISGRPDTPCRFNAALLARDGGFDIGDAGSRHNALGQGLYQVNLSGNGQYVQLFCANLKSDTGAQFSVLADAPDKVSWVQVYAVLNSIHVQ